MKLVCLCCTYLRPQQLVNVIRDFEAFDYPEDKKQLLILDDAGQYPNGMSGPGWSIISRKGKYPTLGAKCNALVAAAPQDADAFVILDDDDGYCKWTLKAHAAALASADVSYANVVLVDTDIEGQYELKGSTLRSGRIVYHGSWAYTPKAFKYAGGYPAKDIGADRELMFRFVESGMRIKNACEEYPPYYVYRINYSGAEHITQLTPEEKARLNSQYLHTETLQELPEPDAPNWSEVMKKKLGLRSNQNVIKFWRKHKESIELGDPTPTRKTVKTTPAARPQNMTGIAGLRKNKTVTACMASIPTREAALSRTVASLISQVDRIKIHLNGYKEVPQFLDHPKIETILGNNLIGANEKFHFVNDLRGYVFICDDDLLYPANYVQEMQRGINTYRCLVGSSGNSIKDPYPVKSYLKGITIHPLQRVLREDTNADVVGTGTLGFHTEDVKLRYEDLIYRNMVDLSLMRVARRDKLQRKIIRHPDKWITRSTNDHGLHEKNMADDSLSTETLNEILLNYPERTYSGERVTVVLINYKRTTNTHKIIEFLRKQSIPVKIYVWNNGDEPFENPHVDWVINSNKNLHGHPLAFLYRYADTEYICRMDDDLIPADSLVLEDILRYMDKHGKSRRIVSGYGMIMKEGQLYENSTPIGCGRYYPTIREDTPVDIVKGRFVMFRQEFSDLIPDDRSHIHVDMTLSFAYSGHRRLFHMVPAFLEGRLLELPDNHEDGSGRGYSHIEGHYATRNQLAKEWMKHVAQI